MPTAEHLPTRQASISGSRVLVVQTRSMTELGLGASIVRTGARMNLCRSTHAALDVLDSPSNAFDAAVLDGELSRANLARISRALRASGRPCLSVGVATPKDDGSVRRLVDVGVMELVIPPLTETAVVEALGRCVSETRRLRAKLDGLARKGVRLRNGPPHWNGSPTTKARASSVPRFNPDIEEACDRYARRARLSPRETSVLKLIALGYIYDEIGEALSITGRTVKMHAANVRKKVGAPNRMALVRKVLCA